MPILPIALTGGLAEGKTTVLRALSEYGLNTASADVIARELLNDTEVQDEVVGRLGLETPLDRGELARVIASNPAKRRDLNSFLHPEIFCRMVESGADVIEVPLLLEACLQGSFKRTWVVTCGQEEQLKRLSERLGSVDDARSRIATQLPTEVKCAFADRIIRTDRPLASVLKDVRELALASKPD